MFPESAAKVSEEVLAPDSVEDSVLDSEPDWVRVLVEDSALPSVVEMALESGQHSELVSVAN